MANGKIAVNSDAVNSALGYISQSSSDIEDVSALIPGKFQVLEDLGFLSTGISKLQEQLKSVSSIQKDLILQIQSHLEEIAQTEEDLIQFFYSGGSHVSSYATQSGGYVSSGGYSSSGGTVTGGSSLSKFDIINSHQNANNSDNIHLEDYFENTNRINKIAKIILGDHENITSVDEMVEFIGTMDDNSKKLLFQVLNQRKQDGVSVAQLLFDDTKSQELFSLVNHIFGDTIPLTGLDEDAYSKVQDALLNAIVSKDADPLPNGELTLELVQQYLDDISKSSNITTEDLIHNDSYRDVLKSSLVQLYNGNASSATNSTSQQFKNYVDDIARKNNMSPEQLLAENVELLNIQ